MEAFMASSPPLEPVFQSMRPVPSAVEDIHPLTPARGDPNRASVSRPQAEADIQPGSEREPSSVRVLNTSLPHVHTDLMNLRERAKASGEDPDLVIITARPEDAKEEAANAVPEAKYDSSNQPIERPLKEQEATSRALKPHSRSVTGLNNLDRPRPEALTAVKGDEKKADDKRVPITKNKPKKWQFGIRSRNAPYEAMKCIYAALKTIGADWAVLPGTGKDSISEDTDGAPSPSPEYTDGEQTILQSKYAHLPEDYYIPKDPWLIRARILKKGLLMPGEAPSLSAHSSAVSLPAEAQHQMKRHLAELGGYTDEDVANALNPHGDSKHMKQKGYPTSNPSTRPSSSVGDNPSVQEAFTGPGQAIKRSDSGLKVATKQPSDQIGVWVYIDIQLYMLEASTYVVDFKCDGYQNVVLVDPTKEKIKTGLGIHSASNSPATSRPVSGFEDIHPSKEDGGDQHAAETKPYWKPTTRRYKNKEKEISSPFPYLDVASELIAHLAG